MIREEQNTEKIRMREEALRHNLRILKSKGIRAEIKENAILGFHKGEPFCVYMRWLHKTESNFIGIVVTRWKGKDTEEKKPVDVLKT